MPEETPGRNVVERIANRACNLFEGPVVWFKGIVSRNFLIFSITYHVIRLIFIENVYINSSKARFSNESIAKFIQILFSLYIKWKLYNTNWADDLTTLFVCVFEFQ